MDPDQTTPTTTVPPFNLADDPDWQAAEAKIAQWEAHRDPDDPQFVSNKDLADAFRIMAVKSKGAPHVILHGDQAVTVDPVTAKVTGTQQLPGGKTQAERQAIVDQQNAAALASTASARHSDAEIAAMDSPAQKTERETNLENLRQSGATQRTTAEIAGRHEDVGAQEAGANQRNTATEAGATARNQATIQGTHENVATQEAGATQRTVLTGQNALAQIEANRQAAIEAARQKFDQDKDLAAFTSELARVNSTALETLKGEQTRQTQSQAAELEKPYKQATAAAETQNAATNQRRVEQEAAYQNSTLDQAARRDAAKPLQDLSASMQDMFVNKGGQARTPVAGAADLVFSPLEMAFSLMHQGVRNGTIDANHVPDYGAPSPAGQDSGTPDLNNAPAPQGPVQSLGPMTPEAVPGNQNPPNGIEAGLPLGGGNDDRDVIRDHPLHDTAPEPTNPDDDEEGG